MTQTSLIRASAHEPKKRQYARILAGRSVALPLDQYESADRAVSTMFSLRGTYERKRPATERQLERWLTHPSEKAQVQAILLFQRQLRKMPHLLAAPFAQALQDAEREGVVWTPLLDAFAAGDLWDLALATLPEEERRVAAPEERVERLRAEIRQADAVAIAEMAQNLQYQPLMVAIAAQGAQFDFSSVRSLSFQHGQAGRLARNPSLEPHLFRNMFNPLNLAGPDAERNEERLIEELLGVLDSLGQDNHPAFDDALGAAAEEAPEEVLEWIRLGRIRHPGRKPQALLSVFLESEDAELRLLAIRAAASMAESAKPVKKRTRGISGRGR